MASGMLRLGLSAGLMLWTIVALIRALLTRESHVMRKIRMFGCLCGGLWSLAFLVQRPTPAILLALAGGGFGIAYVALIYVNSLHNTTM